MTRLCHSYLYIFSWLNRTVFHTRRNYLLTVSQGGIKADCVGVYKYRLTGWHHQVIIIAFSFLISGLPIDLSGQIVLVEWNFPNNPDDAIADGGIPANLAKTISIQGGAGPAVFNHPGGTTSCAAADHWENGANQKYWLIEFTTTGFSNLTIESQMNSFTAGDFGPRDFSVQYKIGLSGVWTTVTMYQIDPGNQWFPLPPTALPSACDNKPSVSIRWLMTSNIPTQGSGLVEDPAFNRIDNVAVKSSCALPSPAGTIVGPAAVCAGQTGIIYSVPPIGLASTYSWSYSGTGVTITGNTNTVSLSFSAGATTGNLTVYGVNWCGNGVPSPVFTITVGQVPAATVTPASQVICPGSSITPIVLSNSNGVAGTVYSWTRNNTSILTGIPASGSSNPITGTLVSSLPQTLQTTSFIVQATAGLCSSTTTAVVSVQDNIPPVFTGSTSPVQWCVQDIVTAFWWQGDITPIRPDWFTFMAGGTTFDLDLSTFSDNCTVPAAMIFHWQIIMQGGASISGTGQISQYPSNIVFPVGTSTITYWLEDQSGNLTPAGNRPTVLVTVHPRPSITINF